MQQLSIGEASSAMESDDLGEKLELYREKLMVFFRSRKFTFEESRDLTQETMVTALERKECYSEQNSFWAWLKMVARSVISDKQKYNTALKRSGPMVQIEDVELQLTAICQNGKAADPRLLNRIDKLSEDLRCVVIGTMQGLTLKECATLLRTNVSAVNRKYKSALELLLKELNR